MSAESVASNTLPKVITIKKYANRRLYNTQTSSYITLDTLAQMIKEDTNFVVIDAKTGEDLTRSVLTQIIVEEENKSGQSLLPLSFMRQIISYYGDSLGGVLPSYLEQSMQLFFHNDEQIRQYLQKAVGGLFNPIEDLTKQNIALFQNALTLFSPTQAPLPTSNNNNIGVNELKSLQQQINQLQEQVNQLSQKP